MFFYHLILIVHLRTIIALLPHNNRTIVALLSHFCYVFALC